MCIFFLSFTCVGLKACVGTTSGQKKQGKKKTGTQQSGSCVHLMAAGKMVRMLVEGSMKLQLRPCLARSVTGLYSVKCRTRSFSTAYELPGPARVR